MFDLFIGFLFLFCSFFLINQTNIKALMVKLLEVMFGTEGDAGRGEERRVEWKMAETKN